MNIAVPVSFFHLDSAVGPFLAGAAAAGAAAAPVAAVLASGAAGATGAAAAAAGLAGAAAALVPGPPLALLDGSASMDPL